MSPSSGSLGKIRMPPTSTVSMIHPISPQSYWARAQ